MELFLYLAKVSAGMIVLYAIYWFLLRRHTYFAFNRFYLLAALFIAMVAPLVVLPEEAPVMIPAMVLALEPTTVVFQPTEQPFLTTEQVFEVLYLLGVLAMLGRLCVRCWQLLRIVRKGQQQRAGKYTLVRITNKNIGSFSFLNYLVVSQQDADVYEDVVLRHELVHIEQRHSWDLLWVELVQIFWWFNPVLIFYKRSLKEIHEFIADEKATNGDRLHYARTLAGYALGVSPQVLTNNFFDVSQLKSRIAMLTKNRSSRWVLGRYLLALPVVVGLVALVAARSADPNALTFAQAADEITIKGRVVTADGKGLPGANIVVVNTNTGTTTDANGYYTIKALRGKQLAISFVGYKMQVIDAMQSEQNVIMYPEPRELGEVVVASYEPATGQQVPPPPPKPDIKKGDIFVAVEQNPEFPGGLSELGYYLGKNIKYPAAAARANVQGKVFVQFVVGENGEIRDPKILKGIGFGCDEEALRVTLNMPKWNPGKQSGKNVAVQYNLPIAFRLEKESTALSNGDKSPEFPGGMPALQQYLATNLKYPEAAKRANVGGIVLINFTVTSEGAVKDAVITKGIGFGCDAEAMKLVLKMPRWIPGTKEGKVVDMKFDLPVSFVLEKSVEGVKEQSDLSEVIIRKRWGEREGAKPLYIVDGKEISQEALKSLSPNDIANMTVLKDEKATAPYGEKGKNGVVIITTKAYVNSAEKLSSMPQDALYIIDGKEVSAELLEAINPERIESVNILKGDTATKKYGEKAKSGVVEMTLKKKK